MKQLTCEMCGSTDLVKQDGVFVCQTCGTKYSAEEARKMMIDGTVEVRGRVEIDKTAQIETFLKMADNAYDANNFQEAENYANKIIEIDPASSKAWLIKGEAVAWQSSLENLRIMESANAFIHAVNSSNDIDKTDIVQICTKTLEKLFMAFVSNGMNSVKYRTHWRTSSVGVKLLEKGFLETRNALDSFYKATSYNADANSMLNCIAGAIVEQWNELASNCGLRGCNFDYESEVLYQVLKTGYMAIEALPCSGSNNLDEFLETKIIVCEDLMNMQEFIKNHLHEMGHQCDAEGYVIRSYPTTGVEYVRYGENGPQRPPVWPDAVVRTNGKESEMWRILSEKIRQMRFEKYWSEHPEEKAELDAKAKTLNAQLEELVSLQKTQQETLSTLRKEIQNPLPAETEKETIKGEIEALNSELSSLGLFKGKEKEAIRQKINQASIRLNEVEAKIIEQKSEITNKLQKEIDVAQGELKSTQDQISSIQNELMQIHIKLNRENI